MRRCLLLSFAAWVLLVVMATAALAQGPVTLQYKFAKDQVIRTHTDMTGSGSMALEGMPNMPEGMVIPMTMTISSDTSQKVSDLLGDGSAWLKQTTDKVTMVQEVMGQKVEMTMTGGKVTKMVMNGQEVDPKTMPQQGTGMEFWSKDIEMRMDKTGRVVETKGKLWEYIKKMMPTLDIGALVEGAFGSSMGLPDHPVAVGESWKREYNKKVEVANADPAELSYLSTFKLAAMEEANGVTLAKVPFEMTFEMANIPMSLPEEKGEGTQQMAFRRMKIKTTGTMWFAPDKGQVSTADAKMDMDMKMDMQMGGQATQMSMKMRNMMVTMVSK